MSSEDVRSLSSASSFSRLDDNESIPDASLIDKSESCSSEIRTDIDENKFTQTDSLIDENKRMKLSMQLMKMEIEDKNNQETITDFEKFKEKMTGEWGVDECDVEEYLEQRGSSVLDDVIFQTANKKIEFDGNSVTIYSSVGQKKFNIQKMEMSKVLFTDHNASVCYISDDCLKIIYLGKNGEEPIREEYFVTEDGELSVFSETPQVDCLRYYKRVGWEDKLFDEIGELKNEQELQKENYEKVIKEISWKEGKTSLVAEVLFFLLVVFFTLSIYQTIVLWKFDKNQSFMKNTTTCVYGKFGEEQKTAEEVTELKNQMEELKVENEALQNKNKVSEETGADVKKELEVAKSNIEEKYRKLRDEVLEKFEGFWKSTNPKYEDIHLVVDNNELKIRYPNSYYYSFDLDSDNTRVTPTRIAFRGPTTCTFTLNGRQLDRKVYVFRKTSSDFEEAIAISYERTNTQNW